MKTFLFTSSLAILLAIVTSCGSGGNGKSSEQGTKAVNKGYFGKLVSIKQALHESDSTMKAEVKTSAKSMDDLVAFQSKMNKMKQDAEADFASEVAKLGLPVSVSFVDSSGNVDYVVKDVKITAMEWGKATFEATIELKTNSQKTMGGQNIQVTVPALMLDENNQVIKDHAYDQWLVLGATKEMKAGETHQVTGQLAINKANASLKQIVFKSYDSYKKAKGWN